MNALYQKKANTFDAFWCKSAFWCKKCAKVHKFLSRRLKSSTTITGGDSQAFFDISENSWIRKKLIQKKLEQICYKLKNLQAKIQFVLSFFSSFFFRKNQQRSPQNLNLFYFWIKTQANLQKPLLKKCSKKPGGTTKDLGPFTNGRRVKTRPISVVRMNLQHFYP